MDGVGYVRCSTGRQVANGISIDAQKSAILACAEAKGVNITEWFQDAVSGGEEKRPSFQKMMDKALAKNTPIKAIIVFSGSRFFRDQIYAGLYRRELAKNGVQVISASETFSDDPEGELARRVVEIVDEIMRKKNAVAVRNAMKENARQGFWNGSHPPLGYESTTVEIRGEKHKKKLTVQPVEASVVDLIFKLCVHGDGESGPLGIKSICVYLNERGYRARSGKRFAKSTVEFILKNETYTGVHWWNTKDPETKKALPKSEWIKMDVPRLISDDLFQKAQMALRQRAPKVTAPRITNSDVLLTGLAYCECGARMKLSTSNGRSKLYRYYACAAQFSNNTCTAKATTRVSEDKLNDLVLRAVADEVLVPSFASGLIETVSERRRSGLEEANQMLAQLKGQLSQAKKRLSRLIEGFANGIIEDSEEFQEAQANAKAERDSISLLVERQERLVAAEPYALPEETIVDRLTTLKTKIMAAGIQTKKRFLRAIVSAVVVRCDSIEIIGSNGGLVDAVTGSNIGALRPEPPVRGFGREWCGWPGSNRHSSRNWILNPARLPIPPHPHREGNSGLAICRQALLALVVVFTKMGVRPEGSSGFPLLGSA
jgi:site-specific DNA recombinase